MVKAWGLVAFLCVCVAGANAGQNLKVSFKKHVQDPHGANEYWTKVINEAFAQLFFNGDVYDCMVREQRSGLVAPEFVRPKYGEKFLDGVKLFDYQRRAFQELIKQGASLPEVRITFFDGKKGTAAQADIGKVVVRYDKNQKKYFASGRFEIAIKKPILMEGSTNWAGTLAHEMLHSLGHMHPDRDKVGDNAAYNSGVLINAAAECVRSKGATSKNVYDRLLESEESKE